jgi:hypothetical protein
MNTTGELSMFVPEYLAAEPDLPDRLRENCRALASLAKEQGVDVSPLIELLTARVRREAAALDKVCPYLAEAHQSVMMQAIEALRGPAEARTDPIPLN